MLPELDEKIVRERIARRIAFEFEEGEGKTNLDDEKLIFFISFKITKACFDNGKIKSFFIFIFSAGIFK